MQHKTFRIFISSTFQDMAEERNHLHIKVFPMLRKLCEDHGYKFQAIDLRWGVSDEAALDQQTMHICFSELARCQTITPRPNFIVLLGDRYGWIPLPPSIDRIELDALRTHMPAEEQALLFFNEAAPAHDNGWYRLDHDAIPERYFLRPRDPEIAQETDPNNWAQIERCLREILLRAITRAQWPAGDPRREKYAYAATHQEIIKGALASDLSQGRAFAFIRTIRSLPTDRRAAPYLDFDEHGKPDAACGQRLADLKATLRQRLLGCTFEYTAAWSGPAQPWWQSLSPFAKTPQPVSTGTITTDHLSSLGDDLYRALSGSILEEISSGQRESRIDSELAEQQRFARTLVADFTGRDAELSALRSYLDSTAQNPCLVRGGAGTGKSTLLAQVATMHAARAIFLSASATTNSVNPEVLLELLCHRVYDLLHLEQIRQQRLADLEETDSDWQTIRQKQHEIEDEFQIPSTLDALSSTLKRFCQHADPQSPLILLLDALDELGAVDELANYRWLPTTLAPGVRLILSVSHARPDAVEQLALRYPTAQQLQMPPMTLDEGQQLLDVWLTAAGRTLQPEQRQNLLTTFAIDGSPLFLKLASQLACQWASYTPKAASMLASSLEELLRQFLQRLTTEQYHGTMFVSRVLGYLAVSRGGLSEDELLDLLSDDTAVYDEFVLHAKHKPPERRLPVAVWVRLLADIEPLLRSRNSGGIQLLSFQHRQVQLLVMAAVVEQDEHGAVRHHQTLAEYFTRSPLWREASTGRQPNIRRMTEQTYQQLHGGLLEPLLRDALCHLEFIEARCCAGMLSDQIADYALLIDRESARSTAAEQLRLLEYARFVQGHRDQLEAYPHLTFQVAANLPDYMAPARDAHERWTTGQEHRPWTRLMNKPRQQRVPLLSVKLSALLGGCSPAGRAVAWLVDSHAAVVTISEGRRGTVVVCDLRFGRILSSFPGECLAALRDGASILLRTAEDEMQIMNPLTGTVLRQFQGWSGELSSVRLSHDGSLAVFVGPDVVSRDDLGAVLERKGGPSEIWDLVNGTRLSTMPGTFEAFCHSGQLLAVTLDEDRRKLAIYFIETGAILRTIQEPDLTIKKAEFSEDGRRIMVAFATRKGWVPHIRLYSVRDDAAPLLIDTPDNLCGCKLSPDGTRVVTMHDYGSSFETLLWDALTGRQVAQLGRDRLEHYDFSADHRLFAGGGYQPTRGFDYPGCLFIWDLRTGALQIAYEGKKWLAGCAFSPDNSLLLADYGTELSVWDATQHADDLVLPRRNDLVVGGMYAADLTHVYTATKDGEIVAWDAQTGEKLQVYTTGTTIEKVIASPNGRYLDIHTKYGIKHWENGTAVHVASEARAVISPDGHWALMQHQRPHQSGHDPSEETELVLKRLTADPPTISLPGEWACFSVDGAQVLTEEANGTLTIVDVDTGNQTEFAVNNWLLCRLERFTWTAKTRWLGNGIHERRELAFSPHAQRVVSPNALRAAVRADNNRALMFNTTEGTLQNALMQPDAFERMVFTPDGQRLIMHSGRWLDRHNRGTAGDATEVITIRDGLSGQRVKDISVRGFPLANDDFGLSPDGRLICLNDDAYLSIWNLETGSRVCDCLLPYDLCCAVWRPDSRGMLIGDTASGVYLLSFEGLETGAACVTAWQTSVHEPPAFACPACCTWTGIPAAMIGGHTTCPRCGLAIRLNAWTISANWKRLAAYWAMAVDAEALPTYATTPAASVDSLITFLGVQALLTLHDYDWAMMLARQQEALAGAHGSARARQHALSVKSTLLRCAGDVGAAGALAQRKENIYRQSGDSAALASCLLEQAESPMDHDATSIIQKAEEAEALFLELGNPRQVYRCRIVLLRALVREQRYEVAERVLRTLGPEDRRDDCADLLVPLLWCKAVIHLNNGHADEALTDCEEGYQLARLTQDVLRVPEMISLKSLILFVADRNDEALECLDECLDIAVKTGQTTWAATLLRQCAQVIQGNNAAAAAVRARLRRFADVADDMTDTVMTLTAWQSPTDRRLAYDCPVCRQWHAVTPVQLGNTDLCPGCRTTIRLNSFVVTAEWQPRSTDAGEMGLHLGRDELLSIDVMHRTLLTAGLTELLRAYEAYTDDPAIRTVQRALRISAHILSRDDRQLLPQLHGRLARAELPEITAMLTQARATATQPWLKTNTASLAQAGGRLWRTLTALQGDITALAVTPQGDRLVSCANDGTIALWEITDGTLLRVISVQDTEPVAMALTPDGKSLLIGGKRGTVHLMPLDGESALQELASGFNEICWVEITPDGKRALWCDGQVHCCELATGEMIVMPEHHWVGAAAMTPQGQLIVSQVDNLSSYKFGSEVFTKTTWFVGEMRHMVVAPTGMIIGAGRNHMLFIDPHTEHESYSAMSHGEEIIAVACTRDASLAASLADDGTVRVWDAAHRTLHAEPVGHGAQVTALAFTRDGRFLITGESRGVIHIWTLAEDTLDEPSPSHEEPVVCISLGTTEPVGRTVYTISKKRMVQWLLPWMRQLNTFSFIDGRNVAAFVMSEQMQVYVTLRSHNLYVQDLVSDRRASRDKLPYSWIHHVYAASITPDGTLVVQIQNARIIVWNVDSCEAKYSIDDPAFGGDVEPGIATSPDGRLVAMAVAKDDRTRTLMLWDMEVQQCTWSTDVTLHDIKGLALTAEGTRLAVAASEGLSVWDIPSGTVIASLGGDSPFLSCCITPDGKTIVAGEQSGRVHLLDVVLPNTPAY